jgi:hypothetical protein
MKDELRARDYWKTALPQLFGLRSNVSPCILAPSVAGWYITETSNEKSDCGKCCIYDIPSQDIEILRRLPVEGLETADSIADQSSCGNTSPKN